MCLVTALMDRARRQSCGGRQCATGNVAPCGDLAAPSLVAVLCAGFTLVEGAGGWRVPLAGEQTLSDLAIALGLPVILVVGVRLGCINHAVLSAEANVRDGLQLAGWVANIVEPQTSRLEDNLATLAERLPAPCLGHVPRLVAARADAVSAYLDLERLPGW